ncbi:MAG TPA: guanylate kinase [Bryobacteraceae bacterium]|nr:guanylate kinase [Bryobacteraceae bacterium]
MSIVFIVSAPSGSGKSTLVHRLMECERDRIMFSVSWTTRTARGQEVEGEAYHFATRDEFERAIKKDEFLEWAEVFGNYYGTHRSVLARAEAEGKDLVLDIDVQGARQLRARLPDAVSVFILAPSRKVLEERLCCRSEDSAEVINRRLMGAVREIRGSDGYDYVVVNDDVARASDKLWSIVKAERSRRRRMEGEVRRILDTFEQND